MKMCSALLRAPKIPIDYTKQNILAGTYIISEKPFNLFRKNILEGEARGGSVKLLCMMKLHIKLKRLTQSVTN